MQPVGWRFAYPPLSEVEEAIAAMDRPQTNSFLPILSGNVSASRTKDMDYFLENVILPSIPVMG